MALRGLAIRADMSAWEMRRLAVRETDRGKTRRMMAIANWNNDIGDYWEWSAEGLYGDAPTNDAYRLGVNYLVYEMTH